MDVLVKYEKQKTKMNGRYAAWYRRAGTGEEWWTSIEEGVRVGVRSSRIRARIRAGRPTHVPKMNIYCHGGPCDGQWLSRTEIRERTGLSRWFLSTIIDSKTAICTYREPDPVLSARGKRAKLAVDAKKNGTAFVSASGRAPMTVNKAARAFAVLRFAA